MFKFPTQRDKNIALQKSKEVFMKLKLVNDKNFTLYDITGVMIGGNMNIDANSSVRRTGNLDILVKQVKSKQNVEYTNNLPIYKQQEILMDISIWLKNDFKLYIGVKDTRTKELIWYFLGRFVALQNQISFDVKTNQLSIGFGDLMTKLNGEVGGVFEGIQHEIKVGEKIRDIIITLLKDIKSISFYNIDGLENEDLQELPYSLKFDGMTTYENIVSKIASLLPHWEYFVEDNIFYFQSIPTGYKDMIILDNDFMQKIILSDSGEKSNIDLTSIHNVVEIWGSSEIGKLKTPENNNQYNSAYDFFNNKYMWSIGINGAFFDKNYYDSSEVFNEKDFLYTSIPSTMGYIDITKVKKFFIKTDNKQLPDIVRRVVLCNIGLNDDGYIQKGFGSGKIYTIFNENNYVEEINKNSTHKNRYIELEVRDDKMYISKNIDLPVNGGTTSPQQQLEYEKSQRQYIVKDDVKDSPFSVDKIGERKIVLSGGDYDLLYSRKELTDRGDYELYKHTRMEDKITIQTILLPFLDVNKKISYKPPYSKKTYQYIIKRISYNFDNYTMSIDLIRFYITNPFIIQNMYNYEKYNVEFSNVGKFVENKQNTLYPISVNGKTDLVKIEINDNYVVTKVESTPLQVTVNYYPNFGLNLDNLIFHSDVDDYIYCFNKIKYNEITSNDNYTDVHIVYNNSVPELSYIYHYWERDTKSFAGRHDYIRRATQGVLKSIKLLKKYKYKDSYKVNFSVPYNDKYAQIGIKVGDSINSYYNLMDRDEFTDSAVINVTKTNVEYKIKNLPHPTTFVETITGKELQYPQDGFLDGFWYKRKGKYYGE